MLAKKKTNIIKYASAIAIIMMLFLAEYAFAKENKKAKSNSSSSSQKSSQKQARTTARKTTSSSKPANRSSSISSKPAQVARQSNVSRSNVTTNRATRQSNVSRSNVTSNRAARQSNVNRSNVASNRTARQSQINIRSTNRGIGRTNRSVNTRTPTSTNIRTHRTTTRPSISARRSTPTVTRSTVRNLNTGIREQQRAVRNTNISVSRSNRVAASKSRSIARSIGRPSTSVASKSAKTQTSKNVVSKNRAATIGGNIGRSVGTARNSVVTKARSTQESRSNVSVSRRNAGTQRSKNVVSSNRAVKIGGNIGRTVSERRNSVVNKARNIQGSRQNVGRETVSKSRIGNVIGERKRTVVERRSNRISSNLTVQPRQRTVTSPIVKQPITDRRIAVRADRDGGSLTRQKSALQTRQGAEAGRLERSRLSERTPTRVDSGRRSRQQLEQRRDRKGIVAKNLRYRRGRRSGRVIYHDRPYGIRHTSHTEHVYRDRYGSLFHRIIWPRYRFWVSYRWGRDWTFCYVHPYYHRKYVFISLGGYWPIGYRYVRYYWYPWHIYRWYGYYPVARELGYGADNYYTYNYYNYYGNDLAGYYSTDIPPVDETTFADVRAKLAEQAAEPAEATLADKYFEEAVKAFELGGYGYAADKFAESMELAPDDIILPFAYVQALFAVESYPEAAEALRAALEKITPEKEGVFYPRGLYSDEDVLFEQIDKLSEMAKLYAYDTDLQLLLGYQLLGVGDYDEAEEQLLKASQDMTNAPSAMILLELLAKIRQQEIDEAEVIEEEHSDAGLTFFPAVSAVKGLKKWKSVIWQNWVYVWFWWA